MKNKIVLFSNIKGGVGKTTLCALYASYLAEQGIPVFVVDADLQASLFRHRKREADVDPEAELPWAVELLDTSNASQLSEIIEKIKSVPGVVLIDCPGNLNDKNLALIYKSADVAIVPMSFDADTVDATGIFVKAFKTISDAAMIFTPNRINTAERKSEELRQRAQTTEFLGFVGTVTPRIKQSVAVKRYTTLYPIEPAQKSAIQDAFDTISSVINLTE